MNPLDVALLRSLRQANGGTPVSDLAQEWGVDPQQIWERVNELREAGFQIEEKPGHGIELLGASDRLVGDDLMARLGSECWLREVVVFEETGSTNDHALRLGRSGAAGGVLFVAERQSAGRGRFWPSVGLGTACGLVVFASAAALSGAGILGKINHSSRCRSGRGFGKSRSHFDPDQVAE